MRLVGNQTSTGHVPLCMCPANGNGNDNGNQWQARAPASRQPCIGFEFNKFRPPPPAPHSCALLSPAVDTAADKCPAPEVPLTTNDDAITLALGESVSIQPLLNDIIPPGKTASITGLGELLIGTATLGANNTVTYTAPVTGGSATVRSAFAVVIQDSSSTTASCQVLVTVTPGTLPPSNDFTWVTPISDVRTNCDEACSGILGTGWRGLNGGNEERRMCAGLVDLPEGLGQQWLVGSPVSKQEFLSVALSPAPPPPAGNCLLGMCGRNTSFLQGQQTLLKMLQEISC